MEKYDHLNTAANIAHYPTETCAADREARLIDEFGWALNELADVVVAYAERLAPVSRPEYEYPETNCSTPQEAVSDARQKLHQLHGLTASLRALLDRVEV